MLQGRHAGKKVVVIKQVDEAKKPRAYPHALVAGIERYPRKVTRRMGQKKVGKRSTIKPFIKVYNMDAWLCVINCRSFQIINYSHLFPTRYALELEGLKNSLSADTFTEPSQREDAKKNVKKLLEERYTSGKNRWFFTPLRVSVSDCIEPAWQTLTMIIVLSIFLLLSYAKHVVWIAHTSLYTSH